MMSATENLYSNISEYFSLPKYLQPNYSLLPDTQCDPAFLYADGLTHEEFEVRSAKRAEWAICEAERNRLVEGSESPTHQKLLNAVNKNAFFFSSGR